MFTCWKCNKDLPDSTTTCPECQSNVTKKVVDNMVTIGPGGGPTSQILPGVLVANRYEIKQEIGRGGMGIVYLAYDKTMEHDVALKVIPQELCMDPKAVADLKRETSIALKLSHPHIMRLHTLDTWEGQAFVVMELVDGGTLAHLMADKGAFPLDDALVYLKQMAEALDYSHCSDPAVVHRDLKPLNILLSKKSEVKIADYGLARVLRDSASRISNQDSAGTLSYMAPEQVKGKGIGKAVDIYALAAIAYEMLSGNPPFYTGDLRWQIVHEEPEAIEGQPDHVNQTLLTALSKNREDRPETAGEFVALLAGEQERGTKPKKKKKKTKKKSSGGSSKKTGLIIGGLLLLVLLAATGYFLSANNKGIRLLQSEPLLTITSAPTGATVFVDEGKVGGTPVEVAELPNGTHTVRLEKEKYINHEEKIYIQQGQPVNLNPTLIPEPFGDLKLTSDPTGATVLVDGQEMGTTPTTLEHLAKGFRQITLQKEEYDAWQGKVEIIPLQPAELHGDLLTIYGMLQISSTPSQTRVFIDGQEAGTTPFSSKRIKKGKRNIELKLAGFDAWQGAADINLASPAVINADLATIFGSISINSKPEGANVYLDGKNLGQTPIILEEVEKGSHKIELKQKDYDSWTENITVNAGQRKELSVDMQTLYGSLTITSNPSEAKVFLDGKEKGKTPYSLEQIKKGQYKLELKLQEYDSWQKKVKITSGKEQQVTGDLVSSYGSIELTSTPSGATVLLNGKKIGKTPFQSDRIKTGKGMFSLQLAGYHPWQQNFTLVASGSETFTTNLKSKGPQQGDIYKEPSTGIEFGFVKGGCYQMGDTFGDGEGVDSEKPVHEVCVDSFWIGKYEVTQGEYQKVIGSNPSSFKKGSNYPVESVSWDDGQSYIRQLNNRSNKSFRLPTEAEWEYAARSGGKKQKYAGGNSIDPVAWYYSNSGGSPHSVGGRSPNGLGLYDMSGNVWEWCSDRYDKSYYSSSPRNNPQGVSSGSNRVFRGGSWSVNPWLVRATFRGMVEPGYRESNLGFRLVFPEGR